MGHPLQKYCQQKWGANDGPPALLEPPELLSTAIIEIGRLPIVPVHLAQTNNRNAALNKLIGKVSDVSV